jgi:hypothetical protein
MDATCVLRMSSPPRRLERVARNTVVGAVATLRLSVVWLRQANTLWKKYTPGWDLH